MSRQKTLSICGLLIAGLSAGATVRFNETIHEPVLVAILLFGVVLGTSIVAYGGFFARLQRSAESERSSSKRLEDSEARFRHLLDVNPLAAMVTSLTSQKVLAVNERTANRFGIPKVDAVSLHAPDFYVDAQQHEVMAEQLRTKGESEGLFRLRTPSGQQFWADVH